MLPKEINRLALDSGYIFRGTTREHFEERISQCGYYCGSWRSEKRGRIPVTSFSISPLIAMTYAKMRANKYAHEPLMLAIDTEKYVNRMRIGRETGLIESYAEIEVIGEIATIDIIGIGSAERLAELYKGSNASKAVRLFRELFGMD